MQALIIDDEPPACEVLRVLLADHPRIRVVGEAGTVEEARQRLAVGDYDLVFLDVRIRGGNGFDLVPHVRPGARIIFVTAYDTHAVRAFAVNALDYLLKPVDPARLAEAISRLPAESAAPASTPPGGWQLGDRLLLKLGPGRERFVRLGEIRLIAAQENYTDVVAGPAGDRFLVRKTMKAWEELLPAGAFVRVHRRVIVAVAHVRELVRLTEFSYELRLDGVAAPVLVSYRFLAALRARLPSAASA